MKSDKKKMYKCPFCGFFTYDYEEFDLHMSGHEDDG
jgi:hypothetical protein